MSNSRLDDTGSKVFYDTNKNEYQYKQHTRKKG